MSDGTPAPAERETDGADVPQQARIPIGFRILGGFGLAALLVALYAVVQITSGDEPLGQASVPNSIEGSGEPPKAGAVAPDFSVPTLDGGVFSLGDHLANDGRPVFINMWAEWCFPCRAEMPAIDAASRDYPEVHFIGIVVRDRESPARRFVEEYAISYQIGVDDSGTVENSYFVWVMPSTYLVGSDGVIIERFFGPLTEGQLAEIVDRAA